MPSYFPKQPNGLLARFSTIPDHFTHVNLTEAEAFEVASNEMGRRDAEQKVQRALEDVPLGVAWTVHDGMNRWREATETVEHVHGYDALKRLLELIDTHSAASEVVK